jgi:hypothetical protein
VAFKPPETFNTLVVDLEPLCSQQRPHAAIPIARMLRGELVHAFQQLKLELGWLGLIALR